ncbi:MAG: rhodoquinone biosynthesis methyltransferase RquA [Hyphomicrobiales bacterium]|nr:rhodoquinone biosynthesis methyltransferase RquA [Hyphomicrobiales bacterium]
MSRLGPQNFDAADAVQIMDVDLDRRETAGAPPRADRPPVPPYLNEVYWWAYVHPKAVRFFERQWIVNLILWGNYDRLSNAAQAALGTELPGRTLQIACAYGDFQTVLAERAAASGGALDVVDVLPVQLDNLKSKLPAGAPVRLLNMDAGDLHLADASYDRAVLFFLLHEEPADYRRRTLAEVFRVVKPGGTIVIVDYARPAWWSPYRYLFRPVLALLEPFALDLWRADLSEWMPEPWKSAPKTRTSFFGGLYQKLVITR